MQHLSSTVLSGLLLATLLQAPPPAPPPPQEGPTTPGVLSETARATNKKILAQMQGAWRLVDMKLTDPKTLEAPPEGIKHIGYCLVSGNYLSIDLHIGISGGGMQALARTFVSGVHRIEFDTNSNIETSTLIGSGTDLYGKPSFEQPNTRRHYRVEFLATIMTLKRDDGHTLMFERMLDDTTRFDIYGRPIKEKEKKPEAGEKKDGAGATEPGPEKPKPPSKDIGGS